MYHSKSLSHFNFAGMVNIFLDMVSDLFFKTVFEKAFLITLLLRRSLVKGPF